MRPGRVDRPRYAQFGWTSGLVHAVPAGRRRLRHLPGARWGTRTSMPARAISARCHERAGPRVERGTADPPPSPCRRAASRCGGPSGTAARPFKVKQRRQFPTIGCFKARQTVIASSFQSSTNYRSSSAGSSNWRLRVRTTRRTPRPPCSIPTPRRPRQSNRHGRGDDPSDELRLGCPAASSGEAWLPAEGPPVLGGLGALLTSLSATIQLALSITRSSR